jgi:adhesin transport system outer membrane protein
MKMTKPLTTLALALSCAFASAQTMDPLKEAARKAIETNPEVTARLNAYRASLSEVDAARGGYYPRVDLSANVGRDSDRISTRNPQSDHVNRNGVSVSVTQMLWDGLATRNEVQRLGHARLSRYFEFVDTSEQAALEAARAHFDVMRFRRLVELAEDNYVQHKSSHDQIQSRFRAGVSRGVDLEQAAARLALAESNLVTEIANLHDVTARYQRIVGEFPPAALSGSPTRLNLGMAPDASQSLQAALSRSPAISAAIESARAARAQAAGRDAAFQPRLEARLRTGAGSNYDGIRDQKRDTVAELVMNWNLFNGGSDRARTRQFADLAAQAADLRDKACRDVRQTALIAYNDTRKLVDQLKHLDANQLAIEKARDAYRKQFDIGQRSLLDLLNAENELYTARRAYVNADHDLSIAYARTYAAQGSLLSALGLARSEASAAEAEAAAWAAGEDAAARCPVVGPEVMVTPRSELDARAKALMSAAEPIRPAAPAAPASAPAGATPRTQQRP